MHANDDIRSLVRAPDGHTLLNVGCGSVFHCDWTNLDLRSVAPTVIAWDCRCGLPFPDGTFDAVYHAHTLEHLRFGEVMAFLRECHRVLKRGGVARVVVPDLEYSVRLYLSCLEDVRGRTEDAVVREHYEWAICNLLDQLVREQSGGTMLPLWNREDLRDPAFIASTGGGVEFEVTRRAVLTNSSPPPPSGHARSVLRALRRLAPAGLRHWYRARSFMQSGERHHWMYDEYSLSRLLSGAGFVGIQRCGPRESRIPSFHRYHLDVDASGAQRVPHSLYIEAVQEGIHRA